MKNKTYKIIYIFFNILTFLISLNKNNYSICLLTIILYTLPEIISKIFKITFPNHFKIAILIFIFSSQVLGEIYNFYILFPCWDNIIHIIFGFYITAFGFSIIYLLNKKTKTFNKYFIILFIISFAALVGVLWELFEYSVDKIYLKDMQKDNIVTSISTNYLDNKKIIIKKIDHTIIYDKENKELLKINNGYLDIGIKDTIEDFISNLIGAFIFSILSLLYLKDKNKYPLGGYFVIKKST